MLFTQLAWPYQYAAMIVVGTAVSLSLLLLVATPNRLQRIGTLPYCSPNWQSLWRLAIIPIGMISFFVGRYFHKLPQDNLRNLLLDIIFHWLGFLIVVVGFTLDRVDGKTAKSLIARLLRIPDEDFEPHPSNPTMTADNRIWAWWTEKVRNEDGVMVEVTERVIIEDWVIRLTDVYTRIPMFKLELDESGPAPVLRLKLTGLGGIIDPGVDKLNFDPTFIYLAIINMLSVESMLAMLAVDLLSTVLRRPFDRYWPFSWLKRFMLESDASFFGKAKVVGQIITLLAVMPAAAGWLDSDGLITSYHIVTNLLWSAAIAGVVSVLSRTVWMVAILRFLGLLRVNAWLHNLTAHHMEKRREKRKNRRRMKLAKKESRAAGSDGNSPRIKPPNDEAPPPASRRRLITKK